MIRIFLIGFLFVVTNQLFAQEKKAVKLKDGSVLIGEVVEDNDYFIKIVIETGDTLQIGYKNIIEEGGTVYFKKEKPPKYFKEGGLFAGFGMSYFLTEGGNYQFTGFLGKRIHPNWNLGFSMRFTRREDYIGVNYIDPHYFELSPFARYYITQTNPRVYVSGSVGYAISTNSESFQGFVREFRNGVVADANIGLHLSSRYKMRFLFQAGLNYQDTEGRIQIFQPVVGEITTAFTKQYYTPTFGILVEF